MDFLPTPIQAQLLLEPLVPALGCTDDQLVARVAGAHLVLVSTPSGDEDEALPADVRQAILRALTVARDTDRAQHTPARKRAAVLAMIAALQRFFERPVMVALVGPVPELNGARAFVVVPAADPPALQ